MSKKPRFWRNVTLIALAHVAVITGLIRWSLAARSAPDAESLVWLSAGDLELGRSDNSVASSSKISIPSAESEPLKPDEEEKEEPPLTQAKSEIELPKPTPMETPAPTTTAKPKATPKSTPKSTPRKTVLAKATKSSAHPKSSPPKSTGDQTDASKEKKRSAKTVSAKIKSSADNGAGKTGSAGKGLSAAGGSNASEFGWAGKTLRERFYT